MVHRKIGGMIDPEVRVPVGRRRLWMKFSHPLPFMLSRYPHYDMLVPRLARALREQPGNLSIIDVGANIGDTASLVLDLVDAQVLAIEPDPDYFGFLRRNTHDLPGVTCVNAALGAADAAGGAALTKVAGTAFLAAGGGITLDTLLDGHPEFAQAALLKIDTDGFDFKVLKGARRLLAAARLAVFFELAPEHYEKVGRENPAEVFPFLRELGYATIVFYDNEGWLVFSGVADDFRVFAELIRYARTKGHYFDVLALHGSQAGFAGAFLAAELRHYQPAAHGYLPA